MSSNSKFGLASVLAAGLALSLAWATTAQAQSAKYSLSGNTRAQIGAGLPLPVTFQPAPNGKIQIPDGVYVMQTAGPDPKAMTFIDQPGNLHDAQTTTAFVGLFNPNVWQVKTSLVVDGPFGGTAMFSAGGRSGPATLTWCPGQPLPTAGFNPGCTNAASATLVHGANMNASLRYQATSNQFGGTSRAIVGGNASVVIRAGATKAPCKATQVGGPDLSCFGAFSIVTPNPTGVGGGAFGVVAVEIPLPSPGNVHPVGVNASGVVTTVGVTALGTFPKNNVSSYGAPWTTGKVTVRAPLAAGAPEVFYLSGSDNRVNGIGSISLVAGGLSKRSLSGDNANRGWLNYTVSPFSVPSISNGGLILLGAIFLAATMWMVRRAVVTSH